MAQTELVEPDETFEYQIGDSIYTLSRIPADETTRMLRRHTKKRPGGTEEVDSLTFNRDYRDRAVRGWRLVKGDPPCTPENKMKLPDDVWREIQQAIGAANIQEIAYKEASKGN